MLRAEARRFPKVAELLERVAYLSDEEIDYADVPLPWYRHALRSLREKERFLASITAMRSEMEGGSSFFRHGVNPSIKGKQGIYAYADRWIKMINSEMLLRSGTLVFFPNTGGVWVESAFGPKADVASLLPCCQQMQETNLDAYKAAFNQRMLGLVPDAPMTIDLGASSVSIGGPSHLTSLAALGVRLS